MGKCYFKPVIKLVLYPITNVVTLSGNNEFLDNGTFDGTWEDFEG